MEIWKEIVGEKNYFVSNYGRIKKNNLVLKLYDNRYMKVQVNAKLRVVHRLVAIAFIPNLENKPQVNHINGIKSDNRVENLEWCTAKENTNHALINGLKIVEKGEKCFHYGKRGAETNRAKKVINVKTNIIYDCLKDAFLTTNYSYKNVSRQLTGERINKTNLRYI